MEILNYSEIDLAETIKRSEEDVNKVLDIVSDIRAERPIHAEMCGTAMDAPRRFCSGCRR